MNFDFKLEYNIETESNPVIAAMMLRNRLENIVKTYDNFGSWWQFKIRSYQTQRDELDELVKELDAKVEGREPRVQAGKYLKFISYANTLLQTIFHNWVNTLSEDWAKRSDEVNNAANNSNSHHMARMVATTIIGLNKFLEKDIIKRDKPILDERELEFATRFQATISNDTVKLYQKRGFEFSKSELKAAQSVQLSPTKKI